MTKLNCEVDEDLLSALLSAGVTHEQIAMVIEVLIKKAKAEIDEESLIEFSFSFSDNEKHSRLRVI